MDLPPKNPWKKGSLVPLSSSKGMIKNCNVDDAKNSINSNNNVLGGLEIAGNKIKQNSAKNNSNNNGKLLSQQQSKQKNEIQDMQDEEEEETKEGFVFSKRMSSSRASSNMYVDKNYDQEIDLDDALTEYEDVPMPLESEFPVKGDFTALMRNQVENNPELKRIYDNHFLDAKRREHDEEQKKLRLERKRLEDIEELKKQTSKPFNTKQFSTLSGNRLRLSSTSSTTNNSHKQRSIAGTLQGLSSTAYERSTEYTMSRQEVQSERGIGEGDNDMDLDLDDDDEDVAHSEYLGFRNNQGSSVEVRRQGRAVAEETKKKKIEKQTNLKPFKISELCKKKKSEQEQEEEDRKGQEQQQQSQSVNSNNGTTQVASRTTASSSLSSRKHLSMKEKRRVAAEEALLQKMEQKKLNSKAGWVVKEQPSKQILKKQVSQAELAEQKEKAQQIQRIEQSVKEIERNMSAVNRQRVAAMVAGNSDMQSMNENKPMTELDIELSAREAEQYMQERTARMNQLHELMEDSVDDLSQMSAADFRQRALFITDFNKKTQNNSLANSEVQGNGQQQQQKRQKGQGNGQVIGKDEGDDEENDDFDSQSQGSQGITKKNGAGGYFIQKNIDSAWKNELAQAEEGQVSRLPQEARDRLDELLIGVDDFQVSLEEQRLLRERNPFGVDEEIQNQLQMIDEQLAAVQMNPSQITQLLGHDLFSLKDALLPSDPQLRHQAEQKILQAKLQEVNQRLQTLFDNANNNGKIGNKVQKIKIQDLLASIVEERQQGEEEKKREGQEEQKDNRNGRVQNTGIVSNYLPLLSDGGVLELQNIQSEFEANEKLLEDSRRLMANMQSVEIDKEIGEYRVLLMEGEEEQKRIEEALELERDQELLEEQSQIMSDLRSRLNDIEGIQEEIRVRERKFIEEIRENHLDAALGITFTKGQGKDEEEEKKNDTGEVGQVENKREYEDYEVEDLGALQEQEAKELQERIQKELRLIEQKYKDLVATEIDSKLAEFEEQDTALTNHLQERDPKMLDELRESIVQIMEKQDQEQEMEKQLRQSQMKSWRMGLQEKEGEKDEDEEEEDLEESGVFEEENKEKQQGKKEDEDTELVEQGNLERKEKEEKEDDDNNNEGEVIANQEDSNKNIEDVDLAERKKKFEEYLANKQRIKENEEKLQRILQQQQEKDRQQEKKTNSPAPQLVDSLLQPNQQNRIASNNLQNNRDNNTNIVNTQNNNIQLIDSLMVQPEQQQQEQQQSPPKSEENHQFEDSLEM